MKILFMVYGNPDNRLNEPMLEAFTWFKEHTPLFKLTSEVRLSVLPKERYLNKYDASYQLFPENIDPNEISIPPNIVCCLFNTYQLPPLSTGYCYGINQFPPSDPNGYLTSIITMPFNYAKNSSDMDFWYPGVDFLDGFNHYGAYVLVHEICHAIEYYLRETNNNNGILFPDDPQLHGNPSEFFNLMTPLHYFIVNRFKTVNPFLGIGSPYRNKYRIDLLPGLRGDVNLDGEINMGDVVKFERIILGLDIPDATQMYCADLRGDQSIDMGSVVLLERYILGLIDQFPADTMDDMSSAPHQVSMYEAGETIPVMIDGIKYDYQISNLEIEANRNEADFYYTGTLIDKTPVGSISANIDNYRISETDLLPLVVVPPEPTTGSKVPLVIAATLAGIAALAIASHKGARK